MTIELSYEWSELDKKHCFGIQHQDLKTIGDIYFVNWVWFHLGHLTKNKIYFYPYRTGRVIAKYKRSDAMRVARYIYSQIDNRI